MNVLRQLFGPSKEEIWRQLSQEINADFVDGGFWKKDKIQAKHKQWTITLDTYTVSTGKSSSTFTRLRAPYVNKDGFYFRIYRKHFFSQIGKLFGLQDIEIGDPEFDEDFIIQGNDEVKVRALFGNSTIRQLIQRQPRIHLAIKDDDGFFSTSFPEGIDQLYFEVQGVIKDITVLKSLYMLFAEILNQLCHMGSAYENDPSITL
jgi:hypothetical protein